MIPTEQHLRPQQVDAWVDDETSRSDALAFAQHLSTCHTCSLRIRSALELKRATAHAGKNFFTSPAALARLTSQVQSSRTRTRLYLLPSIPWAAVAACLVLAIGMAVRAPSRQPETLSAELLDRHLEALSFAAVPQVISTDRHTVKPWFQGKLPFSFNLPEQAELAPETTLRGADLAFVRGQPAALLFFTMRKHQVSVFLVQRDVKPTSLAGSSPALTRSGFTIESSDAGSLTFIAVSDANPADVHSLLASLAQVQAGPDIPGAH
jgi:anti-sigma factor RsiW